MVMTRGGEEWLVVGRGEGTVQARRWTDVNETDSDAVTLRRAHSKTVSSVCMCDDGMTLVSSSWDRSIKTFHVPALATFNNVLRQLVQTLVEAPREQRWRGRKSKENDGTRDPARSMMDDIFKSL